MFFIITHRFALVSTVYLDKITNSAIFVAHIKRLRVALPTTINTVTLNGIFGNHIIILPMHMAQLV